MRTHLEYPSPKYELVGFDASGIQCKTAWHRRCGCDVCKRKRQDRFDYNLIFSACLVLAFLAALVSRCNPLGWGAPGAARKSIWRQSKEAAHLYTSIAMQA
jgi:hypothetical protein